jgi:hypothetical protein
MSKVDSYLSHLGNSTRALGSIVVLEAEMKLLELKITDFENHIKENEKVIATVEWDDDRQKNVLMLSNNEYELRILELQTKIKLNGIMITRTKMMRG